MRSDRLVVLLSPEEKARLVALASARRSSVGELVRRALSTVTDGTRMPESDAAAQARSTEAPMLPADQAAALARLAEVALQAMQRANASLDQAFAEIEATKAYFAAKRSQAGAQA